MCQKHFSFKTQAEMNSVAWQKLDILALSLAQTRAFALSGPCHKRCLNVFLVAWLNRFFTAAAQGMVMTYASMLHGHDEPLAAWMYLRRR